MKNNHLLIDTDIAINYIKYGLSKVVGAKQLYGAPIWALQDYPPMDSN